MKITEKLNSFKRVNECTERYYFPETCPMVKEIWWTNFEV